MIPIEGKCAEKAQEIVKLAGSDPKKAGDLENRLRNAMAILQEEGLYAFFLFLQYRNKQSDLEKVWKVLAELSKTFQIEQLTGIFAQDEKKVVAITGNLDKLFFARNVLAQTLIYALYGLRSIRGKYVLDNI